HLSRPRPRRLPVTLLTSGRQGTATATAGRGGVEVFTSLIAQLPAKLLHFIEADLMNTTRAPVAQELFAIAGAQFQWGDEVGLLFAGEADPKFFTSHDRQLKNVVIITTDRNIVAGCHIHYLR